jgi:hypothetical protein
MTRLAGRLSLVGESSGMRLGSYGLTALVLSMPVGPASAARAVDPAGAGVQAGSMAVVWLELPSARAHGPGQFLAISISAAPWVKGQLDVQGMVCTDGSSSDPACRAYRGSWAGTLSFGQDGTVRLAALRSPVGAIRLQGRPWTEASLAADTCTLADTGGLTMTITGPERHTVAWIGSVAEQPVRMRTGDVCNERVDVGAVQWTATDTQER